MVNVSTASRDREQVKISAVVGEYAPLLRGISYRTIPSCKLARKMGPKFRALQYPKNNVTYGFNLRFLVPAEGLLGASRLAHSLRSGPPSLRSGVQRRCATLSNPACFSVGGSNRGQSTVEPEVRCFDAVRDMPAEGLLGAARLAHSLRSGPPSLRSGVQRRCATLSNPACLSVGGSNCGRRAVERSFAVLGPFCGACRLRDSNPRPTVYKTVALPLC